MFDSYPFQLSIICTYRLSVPPLLHVLLHYMWLVVFMWMLWEIVAGKSGGKFLWEFLAGNGGGEKGNLRKTVIGGNLAFGIG